ncbi:MAG: AAA family ATPase [Polyangiaceae bacterium]|nr:AAA family ATPase [Polyangiaceae bacterium]
MTDRKDVLLKAWEHGCNRLDDGADPDAAQAEVAKIIAIGDELTPKPHPIREAWAPTPLDMFTVAPPEREWLLMRPDEETNGHGHAKGVFPLGKVGMLAAAGGVGKTAAVVRLAIAVALGKPWLGGWAPDVSKRGRVLLALAEEDAAEIHRRLYYVANQMELPDPLLREAAGRIVALPLAGIPAPLIEQGADGKPVEGEALRVIRELLSEPGEPWRLLIFDPLSRFGSADTEKDNAAATRLVQAFETMVKLPGTPSVLVVHHTSQASRDGKSDVGTTAARGVTGLGDGFRWVATLEEKNITLDSGDVERVVLRNTKNNYAAKAPPVWLARTEHGALRDETANERADRCALLEDAKQKKTNGKAPTRKKNGPDGDSAADEPEVDVLAGVKF